MFLFVQYSSELLHNLIKIHFPVSYKYEVGKLNPCKQFITDYYVEKSIIEPVIIQIYAVQTKTIDYE